VSLPDVLVPDLLVIPTGRNAGLVLSPGNSGWASYASPVYPAEAGAAFVRLARTKDDAAFAVAQIDLWLMPGSATRMLRQLPVGQIEAATNRRRTREELAARIPVRPLGEPVPFPEEIETPSRAANPGEPAVLAAKAAGGPDIGWPWWMYSATMRAATRPDRAPSLRLRIPTTRIKGDEFYARVAELFSYRAVVSSSPALDIAAANHVPVSTVHRWVKEARRRGLLVGGERSRRGAGEPR